MNCRYCNKEFSQLIDRTTHEATHDIILVPMEKNDLLRLMMFIKTGSVDYVSDSLAYSLDRAQRNLSVKSRKNTE